MSPNAEDQKRCDPPAGPASSAARRSQTWSASRLLHPFVLPAAILNSPPPLELLSSPHTPLLVVSPAWLSTVAPFLQTLSDFPSHRCLALHSDSGVAYFQGLATQPPG